VLKVIFDLSPRFDEHELVNADSIKKLEKRQSKISESSEAFSSEEKPENSPTQSLETLSNPSDNELEIDESDSPPPLEEICSNSRSSSPDYDILSSPSEVVPLEFVPLEVTPSLSIHSNVQAGSSSSYSVHKNPTRSEPELVENDEKVVEKQPFIHEKVLEKQQVVHEKVVVKQPKLPAAKNLQAQPQKNQRKTSIDEKLLQKPSKKVQEKLVVLKPSAPVLEKPAVREKSPPVQVKSQLVEKAPVAPVKAPTAEVKTEVCEKSLPVQEKTILVMKPKTQGVHQSTQSDLEIAPVEEKIVEKSQNRSPAAGQSVLDNHINSQLKKSLEQGRIVAQVKIPSKPKTPKTSQSTVGSQSTVEIKSPAVLKQGTKTQSPVKSQPVSTTPVRVPSPPKKSPPPTEVTPVARSLFAKGFKACVRNFCLENLILKGL
jgi:hypothetical protein